MNNKIDTLQEIIVKKKLKKDNIIIGPNKRIISSIDFCNNSSWGMVLANYFTFPDTIRSVTITKVEIFISKKGDSPMRLRILDKNKTTKNLLPGNDITPISVLFKPYKKGWNTLIMANPITIVSHQFFIGVEIIKTLDQVAGKSDKQCIGFTKSDLISFFGSDALSRWTDTKFILNHESPMIRAYIEID